MARDFVVGKTLLLEAPGGFADIERGDPLASSNPKDVAALFVRDPWIGLPEITAPCLDVASIPCSNNGHLDWANRIEHQQ
jgi:hypothetical protein